MFKLIKQGFQKEMIIPYGNMFLIGNGHLGYRGTLEEFRRKELIGLNILGFYDQYQDKWRESINAPNPFYVNIKSFSILEKEPIEHNQTLDLGHAISSRKTKFNELTIKSERFISMVEDNTLCMKYEIIAHKDESLVISIGLDTDIYEINGPHFKKMTLSNNKKSVEFMGITNENKTLHMVAKYRFPNQVSYVYQNGIFDINLEVKKDKTYTFYVIAKIGEEKKIEISYQSYLKYKKAHALAFSNLWDVSDIIIKGNKDAQFKIRYSIYHLLILGNAKYMTSIPARGVSGQTYKGAIFWDTEIFLLPFFAYTNPKVARSFLEYRIKTLEGAIQKAKEFGYMGAFYAWESQDSGLEACSKYNVTDPITNEPIRTYFNEKQIHISADIIYALEEYIKITGDISIIKEGGLQMAKLVADFFLSYATIKDGVYHLADVIGPDEYHERIDDNAFTNYMAKYAVEIYLKYAKLFKKENNIVKYEDFVQNIFLPKPNNSLIIEQFSGYFDLEDTSVDIVRKRLKTPNEYWGTKNGVAAPTRIIKQADVITLLCLLKQKFSNDIIKANYEFYYPYTEHGSSLSASMYAISGFRIGKHREAFEMFLKSAGIDLSLNQKLYAGGIYIGGTHPASSGGAYLSLIYGMAGLEIVDYKPILNPHLGKMISYLQFKIRIKDSTYIIKIYKDDSYEVEVM